jgi:FPC/CPF motif-containing protein YcgG
MFCDSRAPNFERSFSNFIENAEYPCVGAKAANSHSSIEYFLAGDIESDESDAAITSRVQRFTSAADPQALFVSLVVGFVDSRPMSELDFETALWRRLQSLHDFDSAEFAWDSRVSNDPQSPSFSMSIGGEGFYIIGVHPNASRKARRFECSALVFNLHSQFEQLRADGRYTPMTKTITKRDIALSGAKNPMLAQHGERSEARQYSGRQTRSDWRCPFRVVATEPSDAS